MSREFIDRLEAYWGKYGGCPPELTVNWLSLSIQGASRAEVEIVSKDVEPHLREVEKTLLRIYIEEGQPEDEWLAILRRPGTMDLSDTLALTVIARWYAVDPMDQRTRMNLLAGLPMEKRSRPSKAYLTGFSKAVGFLLPLLIPLLTGAILGACCGGAIEVYQYLFIEEGELQFAHFCRAMAYGIGFGALIGIIGVIKGWFRRELYGKNEK